MDSIDPVAATASIKDGLDEGPICASSFAKVVMDEQLGLSLPIHSEYASFTDYFNNVTIPKEVITKDKTGKVSTVIKQVAKPAWFTREAELSQFASVLLSVLMRESNEPAENQYLTPIVNHVVSLNVTALYHNHIIDVRLTSTVGELQAKLATKYPITPQNQVTLKNSFVQFLQSVGFIVGQGMVIEGNHERCAKALSAEEAEKQTEIKKFKAQTFGLSADAVKPVQPKTGEEVTITKPKYTIKAFYDVLAALVISKPELLSKLCVVRYNINNALDTLHAQQVAERQAKKKNDATVEDDALGVTPN